MNKAWQILFINNREMYNINCFEEIKKNYACTGI